ncbi:MULTISPECIES: hypothetical protein [unclassified Streptomyces]|uniref:hypothetical protein n=1 Tax=unclassified Streptomyces TaxID=2593676 RepID=UPI002E2E4012|nr:hypothetical protein [Streptomyces sp. NBC_00223]
MGIGQLWLETGRNASLPFTLPSDVPGAVRLLEDVLADELWVRRIAERSYRHANGFDKMVIAVERGEYLVKFDVWWAGDARVDEAPHNHRWDFESRVLAGRLDVRHYDVDPGGRGFHRFRVLGFGRRDEFVRLGEVGLTGTFEAALPAGTRYFLHHRQLHSVTALPDTTTITFSVQGPTAQERSEIVERSRDRARVQALPAFAEDEVRDRLAAMRDVLTAAGGGTG